MFGLFIVVFLPFLVVLSSDGLPHQLDTQAEVDDTRPTGSSIYEEKGGNHGG